MDLNKYLQDKQKLINDKLQSIMPADTHYPGQIHKAMNYSIKNGKRIRPILCLASCLVCGGKEKDALIAACAIEMVHTYSLIHDDLPAMDNDDFRRGRPTVHCKFNEAIAVLTGDALNTYAYSILTNATKNPTINNAIIRELADATGASGMIGGQVADIENAKCKMQNVKLPVDLPTMEYIATHKTGALIAASCKIGAIIGKAPKKQIKAINRYGEYIGFVFQIIDDILDNEGFVKMSGAKDAYQRAKSLTEKAKAQLSAFSKNKEPLLRIADFVLNRKK